MLGLSVLIITCTILYTCHGAFVDTLPKCSVKDNECIRNMYKGVIKSAGTTGIPEFNIPPIDPLHITNVSLEMFSGIKATIDDGIVDGLSKCEINSFHLDLDKKIGNQDITCDLTVQGQILVTGSSPVLQALAGTTTVNGQGIGKLNIDRINIKFDFPMSAGKKDDGKIYINILHEDIKYNYEVEKASFSAKKVIIGREDVTKLMVTYMNGNWRKLMKTLGNAAVDKAMDLCFDFINSIFDRLPADSYFTDDLSPYI